MPKNIGRYHIQGEIGKGGFGKVYRAWDPTVNRQVAIKILTVHGDADVLSRFRNEAAAAGNLHHKNIVTVHDFGEHNGTPYMVMQLLDGQNLQEVMAQGRQLSLLDKLNIMQQVAEGLQCAHQHGIVHRDVKPANLMLLPDGSVQIMDFGIARVKATASRQTRTGFVIGTVLYMSPEQFLPNMEVDFRADIWAYGVIFYELLTGRHPFAARDQTAVLYQIAHIDPPPVDEVAPECPAALAEVLQRALMKDREIRYQSLRELQFDVQPILLELKQQKASELMSSARALVGQGEIDHANTVIQQILELDPANRDAQSLLSSVRQRLHRRAVQPRIDGLIKRADEFVAARNYRQAAESVESALRLSQTDSSLLARLEQIRHLQEQAAKAERLIGDARQQLDNRNLTAALEIVNDALAIDPHHPQALQMVSTIQAEKERREKRRRLEEGLSRAKSLVLQQAYDEAIDLLSDLAASHPEEPAISNLIAAARKDKLQQEQKERKQREMVAARDELRDHRFSAAIARLEELESDQPGDPEIDQLLDFARGEYAAFRRAETIDRTIREVEQYIGRQDFAGGLLLVAQSLAAYPGDPTLLRLQQSATVAKAVHDRCVALDNCLRSSAGLRAEGRIEEALRRVNAMMLETPDEPRLIEMRRGLQEEYEVHRRAEILRSELESGDRCLAEGNAERAISIAEHLKPEYPTEPAIEKLLEKARRLKEEQERQRLRAARIASQVDSVRQAVADSNFGRVEDLLRAALKEFPEETLFKTLTEQAVAAKRTWEVDQAMAKIRDAWHSGDLESCRTQLQNAIAMYPADQRLPALEREIASQVSAEAIRQAQQQLSQQHLEAARLAATRALEWKPADPLVTGLLDTINRESELSAAAARIREALDKSNLDQARTLIDEATKQYPSERRMKVLKKEVNARLRVEKEILGALASADEAWKSGDVERCRNTLAKALLRHPSDERLRNFDSEFRAAVAADLVAAARDHLAHKRFDAATQSASSALAFLPEDNDTPALLEQIRAAQLVEAVIVNAEAALRDGQMAKALEIIATGPRTPESETRLKQIAKEIAKEIDRQRDVQERERSRRRVEQEEKNREELLRASAAAATGNSPLPATAIFDPRPLITPIPEPPKQQQPLPAAPITWWGSRKALMAAAAAALFLIALATWAIASRRTTSSPPSATTAVGAPPTSTEPASTTRARIEPSRTGDLQVSQSRLIFRWKVGSTAPAPQSIRVSGDRSFLAKSSSRWVVLSPERALAPQTVSVSINPGDLGPGRHTDTIEVAPANDRSATRRIVVELNVTR